MSFADITVAQSMSVAVISYDRPHGPVGAKFTRTARAGGDGALHRARVRTDHSGGDRPTRRAHGAIIDANPELQERELIKLASLSTALAETLRRRGVGDTAASLTAEVAIAVFKIAFERWISEPTKQDLPQLIRSSLDELKAVTAGD
jgi:hypothetical protein